MSRFLPDRYVSLLILAAVLGFLLPELGANDGPLHLGFVTKLGISLVFFLHGANLAPESLAAGVKNWKVHALVQAATFALFPILGGILFIALDGIMSKSLRLGFFFLAALPSTISSSVAMTAIAKGNVPVAVFNATLSGLLGLVLTPAMVSLVTATGVMQFSLLDAMGNIALMLLAPFALGQLVRPLIKKAVTKYKPILSLLDRSVILLIVFTSFATSTAGGIWTRFSAGEIVATIGLVLVLLAIAFSLTIWLSRRLNLPLEDEAAVVFCGSTKSLANGAPIAQILFAGSPLLGVILLPLMLYHQLQLVGCAILAQRYSKQIDTLPA
ncbi:MAG: bile acid:sodium symporter [Henriciella sp.]|nr:bile acid:sodium symporter [Henriciella sp.]